MFIIKGNSNEFIKEFNKNVISDEFLEEYKGEYAWKLH